MRSKRSGFTLIELLVVIGIITTLATLIIAIAPRFGERQRASRGASMLQSWLNLAKQRAMRDRRPVGIRMPHQDTSSYVGTLEYIEVPDEAIGGSVTVPYPGQSDYHYVQLNTPAVFSPGAVNALIMPGDTILIPGPGYAPRRIVGLGPPQAQSTGSSNMSYQLILDQPLNPTPTTTTAYRISRRARPIVGETVLQMPKDIAIDISYAPNTPQGVAPAWFRMFPPLANTGGTSPFDILFSPGGQVIGAEGNLGSRICLWVRDISLPAPDPTQLPPGYNTLVTVYTRTGLVTSHEIDTSGLVPNVNLTSNTWNPFRFTQDGLSSGY
jgi:prepilin-type N-terminal cleavage/methylation domain-containing protein